MSQNGKDNYYYQGQAGTFPYIYKRQNYQRGSCELNRLEEKKFSDETVFSLSDIFIDGALVTPIDQFMY